MLRQISSIRFIWGLFRISFVSLPYLSFVAWPGLVATLGLLWVKFRRSALDSTTRNLVLLITGLLWLSCLFAANRGEAFLQLFNFYPYLLLFAVLPHLLKGAEPLARLATDLVIATIPINLAAVVEYLLRSPGIPTWLKRTELSRWFRARPHKERAMVMFGHPNTLAAYLVLVLGLGLGLILYSRLKRVDASATPKTASQFPWQTAFIYFGSFSCLLGIFASGSRNGLLVAFSQLLIFSFFTPASRIMLGLGAVGLAAGAIGLGVGGRTLSQINWANDPRVGIWNFALDLLSQRPWLGWGLGNFKLQYPPGLIPEYQYIAHPHNVWLLLAVEAGIPVMLLFCWLVGRICVRAVRQLSLAKSPEQALLLAYLLAFWGCLAFALFDVTFYDARINVTHWVLLAGLYALTAPETSRQLNISDIDPADEF
jgi:O-antigen ligase